MEFSREGTSPASKQDYSKSEAVPCSPEIIEDNMQVGLEGRLPIQVGVDDPPANFDGGMVPEIVRGFEDDPGRIQRLVRLRLIGNHTRTFA
jgi:hypothetical protein